MAESDGATFRPVTSTLTTRGTECDAAPSRPRFAPAPIRNDCTFASKVGQRPVVDLGNEDSPYSLTPAVNEEFVGVCVVFNMINFSRNNLSTRRGSEKDFETIAKTFRHFRFTVEEKRDSTKADMETYLKDLARNYKPRWKCFVCFILSHGRDADIVYDTDGRSVQIRDLVHYFSTTKCPQMAGKPKLFFVQMCRGHKHQEGVPVSRFETDGEQEKTPISLDEPDMLISFATTAGYVSFRDPLEGSPYIQTFLPMLSRFGTKQDICGALRRTTKQTGKLDFQDGSKMCPCYMSTLTRPVIFSSSLGEPEEDLADQLQDLQV